MKPSTCRLLWRAALLLPLLSACTKPSYRADRLEEAVRDICLREYKFAAVGKLAGKTLYASIAPQNIVGADLGIDRKTVERLYDTLLTVTRVALSTNAKVDYLIVKAKDTNTGVTLTLLRYVPDIKWYFYMRISRADFENRGVLEIDDAETNQDASTWHDVTLPEFSARLAASRLQQKITYNPLVSIFVRVHRVRGAFDGGVVTLSLDKYQPVGGLSVGKSAPEALPSDELLRRNVLEVMDDILKKYDRDKVIHRVRVVEDGGRAVLDYSREELFEAWRKLPKKKSLFPTE
jgi:hypothetical protein